MSSLDTDTISAIATAPGIGGIGIIRLSGPQSLYIAEQICQQSLTVRHAHFCNFSAQQKDVIDSGLALYFQAPASFTGEDVVELQAHGGPVVLDMLLRETVRLGARHARPGEFSERAFLNDKLDLVQAEAIADLINSGSEQAARSALKSLQGEFSRHLDQLGAQLLQLRIYVEAALDFPEEEIDFLNDSDVHNKLEQLSATLNRSVQQTRQGTLLQEGISIAIAGKPNAGKSSLLNALAGYESAIVTSQAGTTRDVLREHIHIDGLQIHLVDTAGLRESDDLIEQEGVRRAYKEFKKADLILLVCDASEEAGNTAEECWPSPLPSAEILTRAIVVKNKMDLLEKSIENTSVVCHLSAKTGEGIEALRERIAQHAGFQGGTSSPFMARRRHLDALEKAANLISQGHTQLRELGAGELLAEDLRQAQDCLSEISGKVSSDELLGEIFAGFCIGK
ncbi:MAG: tRNA uridine-5-carboxymethylaminomethyl(34) synthesis GTPase MnmE [Pseudomonadota bacterium]